MKNEELQLKTKRLVISPMSDEELKTLIIETPIYELKQAYQEMLDGCMKNPKHRLWYTAWKISLKENKKLIGSAGFKGSANNYSVEIGYGIDDGFEGNGYATEAVKAIIDWAFEQEGIYFIEAETDPDNRASQRILDKLFFKSNGTGEEGPRFVLEKNEN
ncbi:MAG: GNAT family N-acetyltransferase [Roseburia sp.]